MLLHTGHCAKTVIFFCPPYPTINPNEIGAPVAACACPRPVSVRFRGTAGDRRQPPAGCGLLCRLKLSYLAALERFRRRDRLCAIPFKLIRPFPGSGASLYNCPVMCDGRPSLSIISNRMCPSKLVFSACRASTFDSRSPVLVVHSSLYPVLPLRLFRCCVLLLRCCWLCFIVSTLHKIK